VKSQSAKNRRETLLIVEPDPLLRWSLSTYLGRRFNTLAAGSYAVGEQALAKGTVHALVTSNDVPDLANHLEEIARASDHRVILLRTVVNTPRPVATTEGVIFVEKPFDLCALNGILVAGDPAAAARNIETNFARTSRQR